MFRAFGVMSLAVGLLLLMLAGVSWRQTGTSEAERADLLQARLERSDSVAESLRRDLAGARAELGRLADEKSSLERHSLQLAIDRDALAQRAAQLLIDREELVGHITAQSEQREDLAGELEAWERRSRSAARRLSMAQSDIQLLAGRLAEVTADREALAGLAGELTGDAARLGELIAEADVSGTPLDEDTGFTAWREDMVATASRSDAASAALAESRAALADAREDLDALTEAHATLNADYQAADETLAAREAEAAALSAEVDGLREQVAALGDTINALEDGRQALLAGVTERDERHAALLADLAALREGRAAEESRAGSLEEQLALSRQERDTLEGQLMGLTIERDGLSAELDEARADEDRLLEALAAVTAEKEDLAEEMAQAATVLASSGADGLVGRANGEADALSLGIEGFKNRFEGLSDQMAAERQGREDALDTNRALRRQIADLEKEVASLKEAPAAEPALAGTAPTSAIDRIRQDLFGDLLTAAGREGEAGGQIIGNRLVLQNAGLFDPGSARLSLQGQALLNRIAPVLISRPQDPAGDWILRVEGHTDATPIVSSGHASNLDLSIARAKAVADYLAGRGVEQRRLAVAGFGAIRPLSEGSDPETLARNRRVEFVLVERE